MHDAGHPFSAHEGEEIFNLIGRLYNTGYFHHNAKGIEVILSEDICHQAIALIPNIDEKQRKQLEEEFYYVLDVVISHDGEATKKDMYKEPEKYPSMKEAVLTKLEKSNSSNNYKFIAQDYEGRLGKVADVLAYLPTDIQDGFRLGIIKSFNEDYLAVFGAMFSGEKMLNKNDPSYSVFRKRMIDIARETIDELMSKKVRELESDLDDPLNQRTLEYVRETRQEARKLGINLEALSEEERVRLDEIIEAKIENIKKQAYESKKKKLSVKKQQMLMADISKYQEFMEKITKTNTSVVDEITNRMREYFINDFIQNSRSTGKMEFSSDAETLFFELKKLNYENIVQYTKWDYQMIIQPEAAKQLVDLCSKALIKSGTIRNKFYDGSIIDIVKEKDKEASHYMKTKFKKEEKYEKYKRKIGLIRRSFEAEKYENRKPKKIHRCALKRSVIEFANKKGEMFAIKYLNVFNAIPYTVRENVEFALKGKLEDISMLKDFQMDSYSSLRNRMIKEYQSIENAEEHKEELIARLIEEERNNMEEKMAIQLSIDYISGMTDRSFNELAIRTGFMTHEQINEARRSNKPSASVQQHIVALQQQEKEDEKQTDDKER